MDIIIHMLIAYNANKSIPPERLAPAIVKEARDNRISPILLTKVIIVESRGLANAKNNKDHGLMQINEIHGLSNKCLYNWECNLHYGAKYLASVPRACQYNTGRKKLEGKRLTRCIKYENKLNSIKIGGK